MVTYDDLRYTSLFALPPPEAKLLDSIITWLPPRSISMLSCDSIFAQRHVTFCVEFSGRVK